MPLLVDENRPDVKALRGKTGLSVREILDEALKLYQTSVDAASSGNSPAIVDKWGHVVERLTSNGLKNAASGGKPPDDSTKPGRASHLKLV